jgi:GntR family transcriptional regulator, transcriptional repressor for pyruvate dehydrogenase complex
MLPDSLTARFESVGRTNAAEAVREQLVGAIESGALEVGDRLPPEHELARVFGVSRPVVREALGSLRAVGFIVSRNGRGSFVAPREARRPPLLGRYSLEELHEVRSLLEVGGAALAARRRSEQHVARLAEAVGALDACSDLDQWVRLDAAFHVTLAEATGNEVQAQLVNHLRDLLVEQSHVIAAVDGRIAHANREHRAIYEAVRDCDPAAARRAMSRHLLNAYAT